MADIDEYKKYVFDMIDGEKIILTGSGYEREPSRSYKSSVGIDIFMEQLGTKQDIVDYFKYQTVECSNCCVLSVPTGLHLSDESSKKYWLQIETRSSFARHGCFVVGGIIDPDYRGDITVCLCIPDKSLDVINNVAGFIDIYHSSIAQLIPRPVVFADVLTQINRETKGFGSTDK